VETVLIEYIKETKCQTSLQALLLLYSLKPEPPRMESSDTYASLEIRQLAFFLNKHEFTLKLE
jgi:hypothetical protein